METTYNGWTNYETWRVNLEMFDGCTPADYGFSSFRVDDEDEEENTGEEQREAYVLSLSATLRDAFDQLVTTECTQNMLAGFLFTFAADVNWKEIAEHMVEE